MVHRVVFRVADEAALAFWADRLAAEGVETSRQGHSLLFDDPEGLSLELRAVETPDPPLVALSPGIPAEVALQGFDEVRASRASRSAAGASSRRSSASSRATRALGGSRRGARRPYVYD